MAIKSLVLFTRDGTCIYNHAWNASTMSSDKLDLLFGFLCQAHMFVNALSPRHLKEYEQEQFKGFIAPDYRLHSFASSTGIRICLLTDPSCPDLQQLLLDLYQAYTRFALKNPMYKLGTPLAAPNVIEGFHAMVANHPNF